MNGDDENENSIEESRSRKPEEIDVAERSIRATNAFLEIDKRFKQRLLLQA
jgi:hypothetical protein